MDESVIWEKIASIEELHEAKASAILTVVSANYSQNFTLVHGITY